jgi:hypothetical protein
VGSQRLTAELRHGHLIRVNLLIGNIAILRIFLFCLVEYLSATVDVLSEIPDILGLNIFGKLFYILPVKSFSVIIKRGYMQRGGGNNYKRGYNN